VTYLKAIGAAIGIVLMLGGLFAGYEKGKAAYADWTFLRNLRIASEIRAAQQQQQQQQQAQQRVTPPPAVTPTSPPK
jgi:hypothetical protein